MSRFRVLVADDEPLARAMVARLLKRDGELDPAVECADARGVREALARQRFDIAFLDIEMPGDSGLELAGAGLPEGPVIVFVTAFSRYAPEAFDVNAVDYVLKPYTDERFFSALERAKLRVRERRLGELAGQLATVSAEIRQGDAPPAGGRAYPTAAAAAVEVAASKRRLLQSSQSLQSEKRSKSSFSCDFVFSW